MKTIITLTFLFIPLLAWTQLTEPFVIDTKVDSLIQLSKELTEEKAFDEAIEMNTNAKKLAMEAFGENSAEYGFCCLDHGKILSKKGETASAEEWYIQAKNIFEKTIGKEDPLYARCLSELALLYMGNKELDKAEPFCLAAINIYEKSLGKENAEYAKNLIRLAVLYENTAKYDLALPIAYEAKDIVEKVHGKDHSSYVKVLNVLAFLYMGKNEFDKAEQLYLEAIEVVEKVHGKEHPYYAENMINLSYLYSDLGAPQKAETLLLEVKTVYEETLGKEHIQYADCINTLGGLYYQLGEKEKAKTFFAEAVDLYGKLLGKEHVDYAGALENLANTYRDYRDYDQAKTHLLEVKSIYEKTVGKEHKKYIGFTINLAGLYFHTKEYEKAETLYEEAIEGAKLSLGKDHQYYATSLMNLAAVCHNLNKYDKVFPLMEEGISIYKKIYGNMHPDYILINSGYANLSELKGRYDAADRLFKENFELVQSRLINASNFMSEKELAKYVYSFGLTTNKLLPGLFYRNEKELKQSIFAELAYNQELFQRGFLLNAALKLNVLGNSTPETKALYDELKSYRQSIAEELSKPVNAQSDVSALEEQADDTEKKLARAVAGFDSAARQVKWQEVQSALGEKEAAIEFVYFKVFFEIEKDSVMYAALLVKPGASQPELIPLFEEKSLDSLLESSNGRKADYVNGLYSLADRGAAVVEQPQKTLYELLWQPLEKSLEGVETVYYSPSGLLHRINLNAIPIDDYETLADHYNLVNLNSTRQLVVPLESENTANTAVLLGGIEYEKDTTMMEEEPLLASRSRGASDFDKLDSPLRGNSWQYLKGTEREVKTINRLLDGADWEVDLKMGYDATEEFFKSLSANKASPKAIHIATHGYFFPDPNSNEKNKATVKDGKESVFELSEHSMLRSGLILAGGNSTWKGEQSLSRVEDGILTAYEISQMDLSNTELVVLSACETGLGDIDGNEGVYGLQRAFKIAGAKYLIMSLWQVPDKQTSLLMTKFYEKWLEDEMTIPEAFHAAQKELRDLGFDPYQWAGFVLVE